MSMRRPVIRWKLASARYLGPRSTTQIASYSSAVFTSSPILVSSPRQDLAAVPRQSKYTGTSTQDDLDEIRSAIRSGRHDVVDLALRYVSAIPSTASSSVSPATKQRYSDLFNAFLSVTTPQSSANLLSLVQRINDSTVISHEIIYKVATLALEDSATYLSLLEQILPMNKTAPETPLIARIVVELDRIGIPTTDIANFIRARVVSHPQEVENWPGYLWQHLISYSDVDTALQLLERYKSIATLRANNIRWSMGLAMLDSVSKPFAATLRQWCLQAPADPKSRQIPSQVAHDLIQLIGEERLPVLFLNQWLNAERIAGRHDIAWSIWDRFDITTNMYQHTDLPRPDRQTWTTFFKLRKSAERACSRQTWKALFNTVHPQSITTPLLNSALSELMTMGQAGVCHDLPALLFLLSRYDWSNDPHTGPPPDARTIDIVAAGLIRIWREQGPSLDRLFVTDSARHVRDATRAWRRTAPLAYSTHPLEWKLVENTLREIMPRPASQRNRPHASRAKPQPLLPMAGYKRGDGTTVPPVMCVTPSEMLVPMMRLVERLMRLLLADRADTDEQLDKAYKAMWTKVQDDILGSDEEALSHVFDGADESGDGQAMADSMRIMQRIFGESNRDRAVSDRLASRPSRAQRVGSADKTSEGGSGIIVKHEETIM